MNNQKDKNQQSTKKEAENPKYVKPAVVATYSEQELEKEFAHVYGHTFVDLFGP